MEVKNLHGRKVKLKISKYLVKWDKPCCSKFQTNIQNFFRQYWEGHICGAEVRIPGSLYRFDLVNFSRKIIVESDGVGHDDYNPHFHRGNKMNFLTALRRDEEKRKWAENNNFNIIRITPEDLSKLSRDWIINTYNIDII